MKSELKSPPMTRLSPLDRATILIVDDDAALREDLSQYLGASGYDVLRAESAAAARRILHTETPDLILLDVMMPGEDGISLCQSLARSKPIPTIFVSARHDDIDRILGLEVGADDYVCKPYNPRELLARIKSVLRRSSAAGTVVVTDTPSNLFEFDRWVLDVARRRLTRNDGVVVSLSTSEFVLLKVFITRPNIVLSRERILELSRESGTEIFDRSVDSQISRFRRKMERNPKDPVLIQTVWGGGYVFTAEVKRL